MPFTIPLYSIIVFSHRADIHSVNTTTPVIHTRDLLPYIRQHNEQVLTTSQINQIYGHLAYLNKTDEESQERHLAYVKMMQKKTKFSKSK